MKKTILALSVLFVSAASLEARERIVQETFEVSCDACGHQHFITEIRNEVVPAPVECVHVKETTRSEAPALLLAGTVIGATVATILFACTAVVASETLFLFGCIWFVATVFSS